jgi:predicted short-subunit dehydrogenase-like oxidoreductase (DUF2520 family)
MQQKSSSPRKSPRAPQVKSAALPVVSLIGFGNWGSALAFALHEAGVPLSEIVVRSLRRGGETAKSGPRRTLLADAKLDGDVFWICTPDAAIAGVARQLAKAFDHRFRRSRPIVFHSSGALASTELAVLRAAGASVASVHPLMTFPRRAVAESSKKRLAGVSFAIEGDMRACRAARKLVRVLGAEPFPLAIENKPPYHAFGAFASPMLVALLRAAVETGVAAGFTPAEARRRMRPIVERTVLNFFTEGPEKSFSGPIARGDAATVSRHLDALRSHPGLLAIYRELARFALDALPAQNEEQIRKRLDGDSEGSGE